MNLRVSLLTVFLPYRLKEEIMLDLFETTGNAFQMPPPALNGLRFNEILRTYAMFTRTAALQQIDESEDVSQIKKRLYDGALRLGAKIRARLKIHSRKDAMKVARLLYRAIGIDFHCDETGELTVRRCYFSSFYPCEVCWMISSLDEGLVAGLTDGGRLWFISRITEKNESCVGEIEFEK